jgi:Fe-S cluster assembly iron-binding protein IscA
MITITERAAAKVKEIAEAENLVGQGLRLKVIGGGCSGSPTTCTLRKSLGRTMRRSSPTVCRCLSISKARCIWKGPKSTM